MPKFRKMAIKEYLTNIIENKIAETEGLYHTRRIDPSIVLDVYRNCVEIAALAKVINGLTCDPAALELKEIYEKTANELRKLMKNKLERVLLIDGVEDLEF